MSGGLLSDSSGSGERLLVASCQRGEMDAWRAMHRRYHPVAAAFLRRLGVPEPDLEDALQDVFLQAYSYLDRFRGDSQLKTWLYRLCVTQARHVRRKARLSALLGRLLATHPHVSLVSDTGFCEGEAQRRVAAALDGLSENERVVFVLYEMEGLPGKNIAEIVGCPEATVWRRLHYARQTFRARIQASSGYGYA